MSNYEWIEEYKANKENEKQTGDVESVFVFCICGEKDKKIEETREILLWWYIQQR